LFSFSFVASPSVYFDSVGSTWLRLLTCKTVSHNNLYCVGGDVKHCSFIHYTLGSLHMIPREIKKLKSKYKIGYDHQSVQSVAGKLSCKRTALKRCTIIEILWYRKLVSRASLMFSRSSRSWRADALKTSKISTSIIIIIIVICMAQMW